jgi:hypothetical protein
MAEKARRIIELVEASHRPLQEAALRLGLERLEETTRAGWSAKEMLAHVAFWEEAPIGFVTTAIRGQDLSDAPDAPWRFGSGYVPEGDWPRADVHNRREAEWARSQTPASVMARWERAHANLVAFLATVTDEEAEKHAAYFFDEIPRHYTVHLPELETLLTGPEGRAEGPRS